MFLMALLGLVIAGLAVRQAGYILMHGSIFRSLREGISDRMDDGSAFFEKLNELFTCKVCMTAQVSIWMVAIPVTLVSYFTLHPLRALFGNQLSWAVEIPLTLLAGFILSMAVAAVAVGFWNLIEFRPEKQEALRTRYEEELGAVRQQVITVSEENQSLSKQLREAQRQLAAAPAVAGAKSVAASQSLFTFADFTAVVTDVERSCKGIGCGYSRRECRSRALREKLRAWTRAHRNGTGERDFTILFEGMRSSMGNYFRELHAHRRSPERLDAFRRQTYERIPALTD